MKYNLKAPPSSTEQNLAIDIPDLPVSVTPVITGTTPIGTPPANQPPTADAGTDQTITLPTNTVKLIGRGVDPEGNGVTFLWTKVSGTGSNFLSPNSANTDVTNLTTGSYVFRITVTDDKGLTKSDDVNITVKPDIIVVPPPNPGKYEGFGVAAASAANQTDIRLVDSKAKFDAALGSNRIIRFTANTTITGRYTLNNIKNLWIDANGFDVTFICNEGNGISIEGAGCSKIILSGLRVINAPVDGINVVDGASDIIIDHCSAYNNGDGNIDVAGGIRVTVSNCIMGGGKPGWGGAMLITAPNVSGFLNLLSPATKDAEGERGPLIHHNYGADATPHADWRNNVGINFGRSGGTGSGYGTAVAYTAKANVVNNYYHDKESANKSVCSDDGYGNGATGQVFSAGNHITNGTTIFPATMANNHAEFPIPAANKITMLTALEAKAKVKAEAGPAVKNPYEQGLINAIP